MSSSTRTRWLYLLVAVAMGTLAGCGDDIVYRDRPPYNPPPDAASGFVGYYTVGTKQTTCGNCHAGHQARWKETAHAGAFATLDANPNKQDACYACHTVSSKGNSVAGPAGYEVVKDTAYRDVQCESCHGSGLEHIQGVGQGRVVRPLAKISATGGGNCTDCHSGSHHPFAEQWAASGHANVSASRASNPSCQSCHDGRGALKAWGVEANYIERDSATAYQATTCAVCHNPHGSSNSKQLRFPINSPDPDQNLCIKCHLRRGDPGGTSTSPHAPQGAMLLGTAGYRPAGFTYAEGRIFGSHATDANPRLCAGCHVTKLTVTDASTNTTFNSTGHLFRPVPCLDANGLPTGNKNCDYTTTARSWKSCTGSGCHATEAVAVNAFNTVRARMKLLTEQLWKDTNGNGSLQAAPTDAGMLPTVRQTRPAEWSSTDNRYTPAEGGEFNARLCGEYGQSTADNSKGVHNPFLCEALLIATINELRAAYGLPAPPAHIQAILDGPLGGPYAPSLKVSHQPLGQQ